MFTGIKQLHPFWWAVIHMAGYLLFFIAVVFVIVIILRGPVRKYKRLDMLVFERLGSWHGQRNNRLMLLFTYLGKHNFLIPANLILIAGLLISGRHYWSAFRLTLMSLSSLSLMFVLKNLFHRKRPLLPLLHAARGKSFPSGHAIMAVNFYGLLAYMAWQGSLAGYVKIVMIISLFALIVAIGFSRIYLQVHYASDVLAGFIIGSCWFYVSLRMLHHLHTIINPG